MTTKLKSKRVLVIGASGGIGGATVDAFSAKGAEVLRPARSVLDIRDESSVAAFFRDQALFDYVVVAAAQTKTGTVAGLALAYARLPTQPQARSQRRRRCGQATDSPLQPAIGAKAVRL